VRRFWIHNVLPLVFTTIPVLLGLMVFAAIPSDARRDYLDRVAVSPIDWIIIGLGLSLFTSQILLMWRSLLWNEREADFNHRADRWLSHLAQAAEWFPLLGLIGTVVAILQTFGAIAPGSKPEPSEIIRKYAPAITATGGGLFMAFINILPTWVVAVSRDLIRSLGGYAPEPETSGEGKK